MHRLSKVLRGGGEAVLAGESTPETVAAAIGGIRGLAGATVEGDRFVAGQRIDVGVRICSAQGFGRRKWLVDFSAQQEAPSASTGDD
jgi:hypothetical protein